MHTGIIICVKINTMLLYVVLCLSILIGVHGDLDEKHRDFIIKRYGKCLDEFNLTPEDFVKTQAAEMDPCFAACYFKDIQFMNDKGMLDVDKVNEISESSTDDRAIRMLKTFSESCKDVNDKEVSDGDKGCERAQMIADCLKGVGEKLHIFARVQNKD